MTHRPTSFAFMRRAEPGIAASKGPRLGTWLRALFACLIACGLALGLTAPAMAQGLGAKKQKQTDLGTILAPPKVDSTQPMLLQADEMIYDNENNRVTAKGNVEIYYGNYTLLADQVIYDRNANTLAAQGNVRIKDLTATPATAQVAHGALPASIQTSAALPPPRSRMSFQR